MTKSFIPAPDFLTDAIKQMKDRAAQRDAPQGERSMATTVATFNALTGKNLSEKEGWEFMVCLKLVRGRQGSFRMDDYVDAAAFASLLGECSSKEEVLPEIKKDTLSTGLISVITEINPFTDFVIILSSTSALEVWERLHDLERGPVSYKVSEGAYATELSPDALEIHLGKGTKEYPYGMRIEIFHIEGESLSRQIIQLPFGLNSVFTRKPCAK